MLAGFVSLTATSGGESQVVFYCVDLLNTALDLLRRLIVVCVCGEDGSDSIMQRRGCNVEEGEDEGV